MKVLVTYMSLTGNTKKVADAIYGELRGEKEIKEFRSVEGLQGYNLVFVGFPMHGFAAPEDIHSFLQQKCRGVRVALFVTHGAPEESPELPPWLEKCRESAAGCKVAGMFNCQGELAQEVIDALLASDSPDYQAYGRHGHTTRGQPDESRLDKARQFAREMFDSISETRPVKAVK